MVQGSFNKLLAPGLVDLPKKEYYVGFYVSQELLEDDLYGWINRNQFKYDDGCLHVYDLGDGILVPCELVDDLFESD